jgi:periplasmic protein TonB
MTANTYMETLERRHWTTWLWALAGALGLNAALFGFMPYLQHPDQVRPAFERPLNDIQVIRIKRPESRVKRKSDPPPEPPPPASRPRPSMAQPLQAKLSLPFEINPRLPSGPGTLALPPVQAEAFDTSALGDAFSIGELDRPLTALVRIPPVYPLRAKHRGVQGWVRVRFVVNEDGNVGSVTVIESRPPGVFDRNVVQCVSGWRFKPGTVQGIAVRAWAETTIHFKLE